MVSFSQALQKEGLHNSYFTPCIIQLIKSRRMSWMGHVALIRAEQKYEYIQGFVGERDHLEDLSIQRRKIFIRLTKTVPDMSRIPIYYYSYE